MEQIREKEPVGMGGCLWTEKVASARNGEGQRS